MLPDSKLPPNFEGVTEPGEQVLWTGKPVFWPFVLHAVPVVCFGLIWGAMDLGILGTVAKGASGQLDLFLLLFGFLHSFPAWGSILYGVYLVLVYGKTVYAYTNRRMMMRSGVIGTSFKSIDYDRIQELDVTQGVIERLFNVGTIRVFSGNTSAKGARIYDRFVSIANPYDVFRAIKGVEVDIKTDWNYPNALRPATNPGYQSQYKPNA